MHRFALTLAATVLLLATVPVAAAFPAEGSLDDEGSLDIVDPEADAVISEAVEVVVNAPVEEDVTVVALRLRRETATVRSWTLSDHEDADGVRSWRGSLDDPTIPNGEALLETAVLDDPEGDPDEAPGPWSGHNIILDRPPPAPQPEATVEGGEVVLSWPAVGAPDVTSYEVTRDGDDGPVTVAVVEAVPANHEVVDVPPASGSYTYQVTALRPGQDGPRSATSDPVPVEYSAEDGEPGDGEPGDGEPGDGEPGDGEPGDGEPGDGEQEPGSGTGTGPGDGEQKPGSGGDKRSTEGGSDEKQGGDTGEDDGKAEDDSDGDEDADPEDATGEESTNGSDGSGLNGPPTPPAGGSAGTRGPGGSGMAGRGSGLQATPPQPVGLELLNGEDQSGLFAEAPMVADAAEPEVAPPAGPLSAEGHVGNATPEGLLVGRPELLQVATPVRQPPGADVALLLTVGLFALLHTRLMGRPRGGPLPVQPGGAAASAAGDHGGLAAKGSAGRSASPDVTPPQK